MNIYVGNLPYSTSEDDLGKLFETYGSVKSVKIVTDKFSGKSRGYGFVEMAEEPSGSEAIDKLNGKDFNGRELRVSPAKSKEN